MRISLGIVVLGLVACGSKAPADGVAEDSGAVGSDSGMTNDSGVEETGDTEEAIVPQDGNYRGELIEVVSDECGALSTTDLEEANLEFWFTRAEDKMSLVVIDDQTTSIGPLDCELDEQSFSCVLDSNENVSSDYDATVTFLVSVEGQWADNEEITGSMDYSISCEGEDCDKYAADNPEMTLPCLSAISLSASWTELDPVIPVEPKMGEYEATFGSIDQDECEFGANGLGDALKESKLHFDLSSRLVVEMDMAGNVSDSVNCERNGPEFSCILEEDREEHDQYAAVLVVLMALDGSWTTPTELSGKFSYDISCEGKECQEALAAEQVPFEVPCVTDAPFQGSLLP